MCVLLTHILKYHTLLGMTLLLYGCILVGDVYAVAAHNHLVMELIVHLIHLHLLSYCVAEHAASECVDAEAR